MAKMFYTASEAAEKLGQSEDDLKTLVREGKLREFRDAGNVNYKVEDVDALAPAAAPESSSAGSALGGSALGGSASGAGLSASGDILLEPVEDSGIEFAPGGSDIIALDESDASAATSSGTTTAKKPKDGTVVPSVGVNVFDDDELDEQVDPLAQTAVTDVAGLGMDGIGSGSGILDLTRESDDTSLGKELLDEIYTDEEKDKGESDLAMGEDTRAGLDEAVPEAAEVEGDKAGIIEEAEAGAAAQSRAVVRQVIEYGPDPISKALTALMVVAVIVMWFAGLGAAAMVRNIKPALLETVYQKLWMFAAGALVAAVLAGVVTFFVAKKRSG